jgi:hypothetical protein
VPPGAGGKIVVTGAETRMPSSLITVLYASGMRMLRVLGVIDETQLYARAFSRLQNQLFRLPWVEGVVARGFARPPDEYGRCGGATIEVISADEPDSAMRLEVDDLVLQVNHHFGTSLSVKLVKPGRLNATLRPGYPA